MTLTTAAVLGTGAWGTTFAQVLADAGVDVTMWGRNADTISFINGGENPTYLPGIALSDRISATAEITEAVAGRELVVVAVPSQSARDVLLPLHGRLADDAVAVSLMKGVELGTGLRMSQVLTEALDLPAERVAVISGPNLADEIAARQPTATVVAATDEAAAEPAGASAEGGEPAGATQAPEALQAQDVPVEVAPALKETAVPKEAPAPLEAVVPQVQAEPVGEAPAPDAVVSAPEAESPAPEVAVPAPEAAASVPAVSEDAGAPAAGEATVYGESEIVPPTQAMPEAVRPARAGWFARLRGGLARTRSQLGSIFSRNRIDETLYEELETALLASDTGYGTTTWLLDELRERAQRDRNQRCGNAEDGADRHPDGASFAAGKAHRRGPGRSAGDDDHRGERGRQDDIDRQAGAPSAPDRSVGAAGGG